MDDEIELVEDKQDDPDASNVQVSSPRIREENHVIPRPLAVLKRRIITKTVSPRGKLLYWWISVSILGILSLLLVLVPLVVDETRIKRNCSDFEGQQLTEDLPFLYNIDGHGDFEVCRNGKTVLKGIIGVGRNYISEVKINVYKLSNESTLKISSIPNKTHNCLRVEWTGLSSRESPLQDCYDFGDSYWYAAYEDELQMWPLNVSNFEPTQSSPFLPHDYLSDQSPFGPILHPLWLNTNGTGILVDERVPLYVSMDQKRICLSAQPFELGCATDALDRTFLNYTVCVFDTIAQAARYFLGESGMIPRPKKIPEATLFRKPMWSTWAEFKANITTDNVANYCSRISSENFNVSQLSIDDGYSRFYGELEFNAEINVTILSANHCREYNITAWVHPFVNYNASNFETGLYSSMYLPGFSVIGGNSVSLVRWWQGYGAVINFIDSNVSRLHEEALLKFVNDTGLSSLKFDAGEYTYLPKCVYINGLNHPGEFTKAYVKFVGSQRYASRAEVRVGYFTQDEPVLVRLLDRASTWDGLQSVLNAALSIGLGGYTFVLPDLIGGNGVTATDLTSTSKPDSELYVRWAQLNTFLPVMQFSITPWSYDGGVTSHISYLTRLHYSLGFDTFARDSLDTGYPIVRPLWWMANDNETWTISDQFYIGDEYMVAPVLKPMPNQSSYPRRVYFPAGFNYSIESSKNSTGCPNNICPGGTFASFDIKLYEILYFRILT